MSGYHDTTRRARIQTTSAPHMRFAASPHLLYTALDNLQPQKTRCYKPPSRGGREGPYTISSLGSPLRHDVPCVVVWNRRLCRKLLEYSIWKPQFIEKPPVKKKSFILLLRNPRSSIMMDQSLIRHLCSTEIVHWWKSTVLNTIEFGRCTMAVM